MSDGDLFWAVLDSNDRNAKKLRRTVDLFAPKGKGTRVLKSISAGKILPEDGRKTLRDLIRKINTNR